MYSEPTADPQAEAQVEQSDGWGRYLGVVPMTNGRGGRRDIVVYENALVLAKVPDVDWSTVGALLGLCTIGFIPGYLIGDQLGGGTRARRVDELSRLRPEQVVARHDKNKLIPVASVSQADIKVTGSHGGKFTFVADGKRYVRHWTRPHTSGLDVGGMLGWALRGRSQVRRGPAVKFWVGVSLAVLWFAATIGLVIVGVLTDDETVPDASQESSVLQPGAEAALAPACPGYLAALQNEAVTPEEIVAAVRSMQEPLAQAAATDPQVAPARDAGLRLIEVVEGRSTAEEPAINADLETVGQTCLAAVG